MGWSSSPWLRAVDSPAQNPAQDEGLCPHRGFLRLSMGRGLCCQTAVLGRRCDEQSRGHGWEPPARLHSALSQRCPNLQKVIKN